MNTFEKATFTVIAILSLSTLSVSMLEIEATLAIAGLLAVAYLVLRQKKQNNKME